MEKEDYTPFGPKWFNEMNKLTKGQLISMLKDNLENKHKPISTVIALPNIEGEYLVDSKYSKSAFFNTGGKFKGKFTLSDFDGDKSELYDVNYWLPLIEFPDPLIKNPK